MAVTAIYYDGRSARRYEVSIELEAGTLRLCGDGVARDELLAVLRIPETLGNTPRLILFADGARCEVADHAAFHALLAGAGQAPALVGHLEARWSYALAALAVTLALVAAGYFWGLPLAARAAASHVPEQALVLMDEQFVETFDDGLLQPSKLSEARRQAITTRLMKMRLPDGTAQPRKVLFRASPIIGPNAFALPGGSVLVLDEIVALTDNDEEILAVLAHEIGHVSERHALRQMLQASAVGLAMAWYVGDVSSVLAAAPTTLLETRYSRDFERNADAFGARILALNGIPPSRLADMLEKLERAHGGTGSDKEDSAMDYLSTHPATAERIRALRGQR